MKKVILLICISIIGLFIACDNEVSFSGSGEALGDFANITPQSGDVITLNSGTPEEMVVFQWQASQPGVSKEPTYTWVLADTTGVVLDSAGVGGETAFTITQQDLDAILADAGIAESDTANLRWTAIADNGSTQKSSTPTLLDIVRFGTVGIMPFNITGIMQEELVAHNGVIIVDPTAEGDFGTFMWEEAQLEGEGTAQYEILFDEVGGDFSRPVFSFTTDAMEMPITTNELTVTNVDMAEKVLSVDFGGETPSLIWTVRAIAVTGETQGSTVLATDFFQVNIALVVPDVTFTLDNPAIVPAGYDVYLAGTFSVLGLEGGDWNEPGTNPALKMELVGDKYELTLTPTSASNGQLLAYKYFLVPTGGTSWGGGEQTFGEVTEGEGEEAVTIPNCTGVQGDRNFVYDQTIVEGITVEGYVTNWEGQCPIDKDAEPSELTKFTVTVPDNTSPTQDLYITGDLKFGEFAWATPGTAFGLKFFRVDDSTFELWLPIPVGEEIQFNFALATNLTPSTDNIESIGGEAGGEMGVFRTLTLTETGGEQTFEVEDWGDPNPPEPETPEPSEDN